MTKPFERIVIRLDEGDHPELYAMLLDAGTYKRAKTARRLLFAGYEAVLFGKVKYLKQAGVRDVDDQNQLLDTPTDQSRSSDGPDGSGGLLFDDEDIDL